MREAPDPDVVHPVAGQPRVVFLRPHIRDPRVEVGEYTYDDDADGPQAFERQAVLSGFGPERLLIGSLSALAPPEPTWWTHDWACAWPAA
jgi:virginiamycin A acetyltransferase